MLQSSLHSIETRTSWVTAGVALAILSVVFGAPWIVMVALKDIAAEFGGARSVPALASFLGWFGTAAGGTRVNGGAGGTLLLNNVAYTTAEPLVLNGGNLWPAAGTNSYAGPVTLLGQGK